VIDARARERRKRERHKAGQLRNLVLKPSTLVRYKAAVLGFFEHLEHMGVSIPRSYDNLDDELADYLEVLWQEGEARSVAGDTISGLQHLIPRTKKKLLFSWRLYSAWAANELPARAPPLDEPVVEALCGLALKERDLELTLVYRFMFTSYLRTSEVLGRVSADFSLAQDLSAAVANLGLTKSGQRRGQKETVTINDEVTLLLLHLVLEDKRGQELIFPEGTARFRGRFGSHLKLLGLENVGFRPYSFRRGGATCDFLKHGSYDRCMDKGRWRNSRTARIYIDEAAVLMRNMGLTVDQRAKIVRAQNYFQRIFC